MKTTKALIIIDMLNDFVTGKLSNPHAEKITPVIASVLSYARENEDWSVVYANDAHDKEDREMEIWGEHAMAGTEGAQVIPQLAPRLSEREWEEPKHFYGGFEQTDLAKKLRARGVEEVYLTGQHTNCCVRHTAYGAFQEGLRISVIKDAVAVFGDASEEEALAYLQQIYGAQVIVSKEILLVSKV